jgi:hypothetical protein
MRQYIAADLDAAQDQRIFLQSVAEEFALAFMGSACCCQFKEARECRAGLRSAHPQKCGAP